VPPSRQVLKLLTILKRGEMRREAAREMYAGASGEFEEAVVKAGGLVQRYQKTYGDGPPVWFLVLTTEGARALTDGHGPAEGPGST
jgi:hypothetical protein